MNTKTLDQIKNEYYGEVGAPERDRLCALALRYEVPEKN